MYDHKRIILRFSVLLCYQKNSEILETKKHKIFKFNITNEAQ